MSTGYGDQPHVLHDIDLVVPAGETHAIVGPTGAGKSTLLRLLLRFDVHILFDKGYLGVDNRHRLHVSPRLKSDFGNGDEFYRRAGSMIDLPDRPVDRPSPDSVNWHMDVRFLA